MWISSEAISRDGQGILQELASNGAGDEAFVLSRVCPGRTIQPGPSWTLPRACPPVRPGVTRRLGRCPLSSGPPTACSRQNSTNTSELCLNG